MTFPKIMRGENPIPKDGTLTFNYLNSYGKAITKTLPVLTPDKILKLVKERMDRFNKSNPSARESEKSRADRKYISAHPVSILKEAFNKANNHQKMEMEMMLSKDSHYGNSTLKWVRKNEVKRQEVISDNNKPFQIKANLTGKTNNNLPLAHNY